MAAADGSIIIDVRANTQQATSALTKLAKLAATAFAVDKIIDFSKQAIQLGCGSLSADRRCCNIWHPPESARTAHHSKGRCRLRAQCAF